MVRKKEEFINFRVMPSDLKKLERDAESEGYQSVNQYVRDLILDNKVSRPINNAQMHELIRLFLSTFWEVKYLASEFLQDKHSNKSAEEIDKIVNDFMTQSKKRRDDLLANIIDMK